MKLSKTDRYLFTFLSTANTSQIKAIISTLNLCQQKTLIEICYYILQVVPVTTGEKTKLSSHQKNIRKKNCKFTINETKENTSVNNSDAYSNAYKNILQI